MFLGGTKPICGLYDLQNYFEIYKNWGILQQEVLVYWSYETLREDITVLKKCDHITIF